MAATARRSAVCGSRAFRHQSIAAVGILGHRFATCRQRMTHVTATDSARRVLSYLRGRARSVTSPVRPRTPVDTTNRHRHACNSRRASIGAALDESSPCPMERCPHFGFAGTLWIEPVRLWGFRISASTTCATSTPACSLPKVSRSPWFQRGSGTGSPAITAAIYSHALKGHDGAAAVAIEAAMKATQ